MTTPGMLQKLNAQVKSEFYASHLYLRLGDWCTEHSLNGAATFLRNQAQNNLTHMMSLFEHMKNEGANPIISAIAPPACDCDSLEGLFLHTIEDLRQRSASLNELTQLADACHDDATFSLLSALCARHAEDKQFLQGVLDEVRAASRDGVPLTETDRCFFNLINYEQH